VAILPAALTQVHRATEKKTLKRPSLTSSLFGSHRSCTPFIVSCVMAFDSWPRKFVTDCQHVSYAASYLSDIAMMWGQPILVTFPEPSIHNDWGEFVNQLNTYFGQPDLAQTSKCTLCTLKMYDHQHVNKYMIEFSDTRPTQGGMMWLFMVSSTKDLLSTSRTSSCHWITPNVPTTQGRCFEM